MTNKDRLETSFENAKQKATILHKSPSFRKEVEAFRLKWHLPSKGLSRTSSDDWRIWLRSQEGVYALRPDDIDREVERHKRKYSSSKKWVGGFEKLIRPKTLDLKGLNIQRVIQNDITHILINHKLNPRWYSYLERYLLFNTRSSVPSGIEIVSSIDDATGLDIILVKVTDEITKADFSYVLDEVNRLQSNLTYYRAKKSIRKRTLERNAVVSNMWRQRDRAVRDKIKAYLDKNYPKKSGEDHTDSDIYKMLSEHRKNTEKSQP